MFNSDHGESWYNYMIKVNIMRKVILSICLSFVFSSGILSNSDNGKFRIEGVIDRSFDGQLAILYTNDNNRITIYSDTVVIKKGQFLFKGNEDVTNFSFIAIEDKDGNKTRPVLEMLLESGTTNVSFSEDQPRMKGSPLNETFMEFQDSMRYYNGEIAKIQPKWENELVIFPGTELERLYYAQGKYVMNFMKQNILNKLGNMLFLSNLNIGFISMGLYVYNSKAELEDIFAFVDAETRKHPRFISYMKAMKKAKEAPSFVGMKVENYTFTTPDGETKQLSDFFGKKDYVFVEFWASWCGPCLASIPRLKELYTEYSDKLEIVSISFDSEQTSWMNALNAQEMPWPQLAEFKGTQSDIAKRYEIKGIPFGLLLDKQGVIIIKTSSEIVLKSFLQDKTDKMNNR